MEFLSNYWPLLIVCVAVIASAAIFIYRFIKMPRSEQMKQVQEWLLWAVAKAEKELGSGTGQLKLHYVYDMFVARFPYVAPFLSFDQFRVLVDKALLKLNELIANNTKSANFIEGE